MRKIKNILAIFLVLAVFATACSVNVFALSNDNDVDIISDVQNVYEYGDVNLDLNLDISDATRISLYLVSLVRFNKTQKQLSDVNGDGDINIIDVTYTQRIIADFEDHKYSDIIYLPIVPVM